ncbi:MAG TPA: hypothetical protein PK760_13755, partial [Flavobacteriales bacterium]|nr:hypothetical protein [Flavobacteriales bacterium]
DKRATTSTRGSAELFFINEDEWMDYTIRFQNTGTFPAEFVVITDTIAPELDMLSFEQGVASHPFTVSFKPGRVIEWRFDNIDLPDSTSDEAGSHGLVKFRMKPVQPLASGTVIENVANIYFDFNDPVITEPSVLTAEFSTGVTSHVRQHITLAPNPSNGHIRVLCAGCDAARMNYSVCGVDGRVVKQGSIGAWSEDMDITDLGCGAYVLHLTGPTGTRTLSFIRSSEN